LPGEPGYCPLATPVCDLANRTCVAVSPSQCQPCNDPTACDPGDGSFLGDCVTRTVMDVEEQVCLRSCSDEAPCPSGLSCSSNFCIPPVSASCTTWLRAATRSPCYGDEDCNPLGADAAFYPNSCNGATPPTIPEAGLPPGPDGGMMDAGRGTPGTCLQPCSTAADCFDQVGGQTCDAPLFFCQVPVP
jgi:hypothetical protein